MYLIRATPLGRKKPYEMYAPDFEQAFMLYELAKQVGLEVKGVDGETFTYWPPTAILCIELLVVPPEKATE